MDKPVYLTLSGIARELGYAPGNMSTVIKPWKNDPEASPPEPDAYSHVKGGYLSPLWLPTRVPEWFQWDTDRRALGRARQAAGGRKGSASRLQQT